MLVCVIVCDSASTDPASNKKSLLGLWDRLVARQFPTSRPFTVFAKLTDAEGRYRLQVRLVELSTNEVMAEAEGEAEVVDRLGTGDVMIPFPPLPFPREGRYEVQLLANGAYLGGSVITAVSAS